MRMWSIEGILKRIRNWPSISFFIRYFDFSLVYIIEPKSVSLIFIFIKGDIFINEGFEFLRDTRVKKIVDITIKAFSIRYIHRKHNNIIA